MSANASDTAKAILIGIVVIIGGIIAIAVSQMIPSLGWIVWIGIVIIMGGLAILVLTIKNAL